MIYTKTNLEDFVESELTRLKIKTPMQLINIEWLAKQYNILLVMHNKPTVCGVFKGIEIILLNDSGSYFDQREQFFHELGHLLIHGGVQDKLTDSFVELQEYKANNFALLYSIPTFMLKKYIFNFGREEAINTISERFHVSLSFATKRYDHYENQQQGAVIQKTLNTIVAESSQKYFSSRPKEAVL